MIEPTEKKQLETRKGTHYEIWKWVCPQCKKERSTLFIDDEICHGEGYVISCGPELAVKRERCTECWGNEITE